MSIGDDSGLDVAEIFSKFTWLLFPVGVKVSRTFICIDGGIAGARFGDSKGLRTLFDDTLALAEEDFLEGGRPPVKTLFECLRALPLGVNSAAGYSTYPSGLYSILAGVLFIGLTASYCF